MRGIIVCLAFICGRGGVAGLCAASVPALSGASSIFMDALPQGAERAAELPTPSDSQNAAGGLGRSAVLSSCANSLCASLGHMFEQAQQGYATA